MSKKIILSSNSPRRQQLLAGLDLDFVVDTDNNFEEGPEPGVDAYKVPMDMSIGKSHGFHRPLEEDEVLITSDTVVIVDGKVWGKPCDAKQAKEMLSMLSGRSHEVVTAVTIRTQAEERSFSELSKVHFKQLRESEIDYYVDKYRPLDKAGAYGIQEWIGYIGISSIEGSHYNVMGFPVQRVWEELQDFL